MRATDVTVRDVVTAHPDTDVAEAIWAHHRGERLDQVVAADG